MDGTLQGGTYQLPSLQVVYIQREWLEYSKLTWQNKEKMVSTDYKDSFQKQNANKSEWNKQKINKEVVNRSKA